MGKKVQNYNTFCIWSERTQEDSFVLSLFFLSIHSFEIRASMKKPYKTVVINACIFCNSFLHSMYSQILYHRYFNYSSFSLCSTDNGFSMFRLKYRVTDSPWWIAEEKKNEIRNYCWELPRFAFFFLLLKLELLLLKDFEQV